MQVASLSGRALRYVAGSKRRRRVGGAVVRAAVPLLPRRPPPRDPVFILGAPRSGTSMLFELLGRSPHLASLSGESHLLWELFHPSWSPRWRSHALGSEDVTEGERRALYWIVHAVAGGRRYLDKSPRNALRVPYLAEVFPGAWFVFLKRDGRAVVSSLLTGWRSGDPRFPGTRLPRPLAIEGYGGGTWKFLVPPGWEAYAEGSTLREVCAFQWVAATEAIMAAREAGTTDRWVEVAYEDLVASPRERTSELLESLGMPADERVLEVAGRLDEHVTRAVTPPRADKWREENREEVLAVLPMIAPTMRKLGYEVRDGGRAG